MCFLKVCSWKKKNNWQAFGFYSNTRASMTFISAWSCANQKAKLAYPNYPDIFTNTEIVLGACWTGFFVPCHKMLKIFQFSSFLAFILSAPEILRRSLVGCSPWGHEEWNTTEQLHFHFSLSCIPGTGEPGGLPSMGSHRVGHDWSDLAAAAAAGCFRTWLPSSPPPPLFCFLFFKLVKLGDFCT